MLADVRRNLAGPPGREEYERGHLPGAHWVDLETELAGPPGEAGRHPLPDPAVFAAAMRRIGVSADRLVVAYDAATGQSASRLWWLLADAGHRLVRVLDGGFAAWRAFGGPVKTGPDWPEPPGDFLAQPGRCPQIDSTRLLERLPGAAPGSVVDVRANERYTGEREPVDPVAGHIPGALNLPTTDNVDPTGRFRPVAELAARFAGLPPGPVVYCGSGVTATHTLLALAVAGRPDGVLYPGSWSEWIRDPRRPVARG